MEFWDKLYVSITSHDSQFLVVMVDKKAKAVASNTAATILPQRRLAESTCFSPVFMPEPYTHPLWSLNPISGSSKILLILDQYDHQQLAIRDTTAPTPFELTYDAAKAAIMKMAAQTGIGGGLFGREKDQSFKSSIGAMAAECPCWRCGNRFVALRQTVENQGEPAIRMGRGLPVLFRP